MFTSVNALIRFQDFTNFEMDVEALKKLRYLLGMEEDSKITLPVDKFNKSLDFKIHSIPKKSEDMKFFETIITITGDLFNYRNFEYIKTWFNNIIKNNDFFCFIFAMAHIEIHDGNNIDTKIIVANKRNEDCPIVFIPPYVDKC